MREVPYKPILGFGIEQANPPVYPLNPAISNTMLSKSFLSWAFAFAGATGYIKLAFKISQLYDTLMI
jgi:hypothetical protein